MDYYQTHDEIDEIGEGLIRKYQYQSFIQGTPTDIEDFITSNLGYRIVYDRIAEGDAGKMAFLADGKTALLLWRNGRRVSIVPPKGLIIVDEYLRQEQNHRKRRFVLAHEAGHILMNRLGNNPVTSAFSREFDTEKQYTVKELAGIFSIAESMATAMGVALLMPRTSVVRYVRSRGYAVAKNLYTAYASASECAEQWGEGKILCRGNTAGDRVEGRFRACPADDCRTLAEG